MLRDYGVRVIRDGPEAARLFSGFRLAAGDVAAFVYTMTGRSGIIYREGVNGYTMLHEYLHALHFIREGRSYQRYRSLGHAVTEQFVYDNLKLRYSNLLTAQELRDMILQVFSRGGFAW